ncbi:hypothetical protein EVAR_81564_1 [Eumeta japonica]|uniref:Uncharacterized protein n=1 Tax=Eumeta variegata TaxID=151549 RepID=A0A4C1UZ97_EUMVA|nr:hypothetical protein EVAR_81564_1 [Eumeta japonica]
MPTLAMPAASRRLAERRRRSISRAPVLYSNPFFVSTVSPSRDVQARYVNNSPPASNPVPGDLYSRGHGTGPGGSPAMTHLR